MKKMNFFAHIRELRMRLIKIIFCFFIACLFSYLLSDYFLYFLLLPLNKIYPQANIIYTDLSELFFVYLKISIYYGFIFTLPFLLYQIYKFISPGLLVKEKKIVLLIFIISPLLFILATALVYFVILPKAWGFFISFAEKNHLTSLNLEAKISEYVNLTMQLTWGFGVAFQMPVIIMLFALVNIINSKNLSEYRRISTVLIFLIAGILTPPDIFSQFALAIPMLLLYEFCILLCKKVEK